MRGDTVRRPIARAGLTAKDVETDADRLDREATVDACNSAGQMLAGAARARIDPHTCASGCCAPGSPNPAALGRQRQRVGPSEAAACDKDGAADSTLGTMNPLRFGSAAGFEGAGDTKGDMAATTLLRRAERASGHITPLG